MDQTSSPSWSALRVAVLQRDGGRCVECGTEVQHAGAHVHHVIPRAFGGTDTEDNLVALCSACHAGKHLNLQVSLARRLIERWAWHLARWLSHDLRGRSDGEKLGAVMRLFGITRLRPGQLDAILAALKGESLLFVSPTGSGKSFCFHAPAMMHNGSALVVAPLKALMSDQVRSLHRRRIPASFINGDLSPMEKKARYELYARQALKFLFCAPERFDRSRLRENEVDQIEATLPSYLVIDEAHCVDKWGAAFRPSYRQLGDVRRRLGSPPVLAFTATASPRTRQRILTALDIPDARVILHDVDRPNIKFLRLSNESDDARAQVVESFVKTLHERSGGQALVFVPTIKKGAQVEGLLRARGLNVGLFHGRLSAKERDNLQARFDGRLSPRLEVMICTSAFGMGVDIPNIRLVFHWQAPGSIEDYLQEFGRAGRDGKTALAVLFHSEGDNGLLEWMLDKSLEGSELSPHDLTKVRNEKLEAITELHDMVRDERKCFRDGLNEALGASGRRQRSLAVRLLEWIYSERPPKQRSTDCCDACSRVYTNEKKHNWGLDILRRMPAASSKP
jgi:ATP-dependent DNA helicase RecQ